MSRCINKLSILLLLFSLPCAADWQLQKQDSAITFVSTKQAHIREVHQVEDFEVAVSGDKSLEITLDLISVESGIEIRNTRMKEMLFNVSQYRYATLSLTLPDTLTSIATVTRYSVTAELQLNGKQAPVQLEVLLAPGKKHITASLLKPVIVHAQQFGLEQGVDALRNIAGLTSIGYSVPVNAVIVLSKQ